MKRKYISIPTEKEAVQFDGENFKECKEFIGNAYDKTLNFPNVRTLEGVMRVDENDYIIKGLRGEFYPCKPDIFEKSYREVK